MNEDERRSSLESGVALFNAGQFWHAHEAWERIWLEESGEEKRFLQGLIQLAAAYHHVQRGTSPRGAVRLFDAAFAKLAAFAPMHGGVDCTTAVAVAEKHRELIASGEPSESISYPKLTLHSR